MTPKVAEQFWANVNMSGPTMPHMDTPCWEWMRARCVSGYGRLRDPVAGKTVRAHRVAWVRSRGAIPDGFFVCHRCDNPPCCNPAHLFLGKAADNVADKMAKGRHVALRGDASGPRRNPERMARGGDVGSAKLTDESVRQIRALRSDGWSFAALGRAFGISRPTARDAATGETWRHVR